MVISQASFKIIDKPDKTLALSKDESNYLDGKLTKLSLIVDNEKAWQYAINYT